MKQRFGRPFKNEQGYILLTLLLCVALMSIGFAVVVQSIGFQIQRDREEELIHRGTQYSRAVRRFIKAYGRYPNNIDELENTNHVRFLRKRYKDPITGKDFRPIHLLDLPRLSAAPQGVPSANAEPSEAPTTDANSPPRGGVQNQSIGTALSESTDPNPSGPSDKNEPAGGDETLRPLSQPIQTSGLRQVSGRGPIVGVASISKHKTIREFDRKDQYNEWKFIYDPANDHGGLMKTPNQPVFPGQIQSPQLQETQNSTLGAQK